MAKDEAAALFGVSKGSMRTVSVLAPLAPAAIRVIPKSHDLGPLPHANGEVRQTD